MAPRERRECFPPEDLVALIEATQPEVDALFDKYGLSPAEADEIHYESVASLGLRWHRVPNRKLWLLATIEYRCQVAIAAAAEADSEPAN